MNEGVAAVQARSRTRLQGFTSAVLGCVAVLGAAALLVLAGSALADFDQRNTHVPGHFVYGALFLAPSVVQLLYVVPARAAAVRKGRRSLATGILVGAVLVFLLNGTLVALLMYLTNYPD